MHSPTPTRKPGGIVVVLAFAGITASLMQTLVVPLLGDMPRLLGTSASNATWVVTATLLAGSVATTVLGRLGDLYGKRRMLLVCTVPLIAGSVVCALAGSLATMIIGRALQGIGMGIVPLGISALRDLLPPERLGSAIALISSSLGIGGALGLPLAAIVAERSSWRALFWGAAVLGCVIALLIWLRVPATPPRASGTFDFVGAGVLGSGLICLLLSVSKGADWGWTSGTTLGLGGAAVVVLLTWGWWELRTRHPLVDLRVTARPQVLVTNVASIALGLSMYAQALILPQLLQLPRSTGHGLGQTMLAMGLWMAPAGLVMMLLSPVGARLSDARGPKVTLVVGSLVLALGYGSSVVMLGSPWTVMIVSAVCSMGVGLAYGAMPALIMAGVPETDTAAANSFNTLMRSIGTSVSAAMVGVVLSQMTVERGGLAVPSEGAFRTGMLIGCALALVAAAVASVIPVRRTRRAPGYAVAPETSPATVA
ncbi:MFS transporter [Yinghuangia sp. ASG 101]|uniref:MFS transporter n=1 Tax=Yinghuangia sp. ASG 101 TaxID=2896848 RepID=UPI001E6197F2|nr:MFS transporter [Yinghuangia sp. ASG 101]UGQ10842.1 MFS transporter [Yinghuangia sp. ASG 101]